MCCTGALQSLVLKSSFAFNSQGEHRGIGDAPKACRLTIGP